MTKRPKTYPYNRHTFGDAGENSAKNILSLAFGYTKTQKEPATAATTLVHAAITGSATVTTTVTTGITDPDVPRNLTVTAGGTAADISAADVVITGTNIEGKTITETFDITVNTAGTIVGTKAFRTVTSILVPVQDGAAATFAIGVGDLIGLNHRTTSSTVFRVLTNIAGVLAIEAASADANSTSNIEDNTFTPTTTADGATSYTAYYYDPTWHLAPTNDDPSYTV